MLTGAAAAARLAWVGEDPTLFIGDLAAERSAGGFSFGWWRADRWGEAVGPHGHEDAHFMFALGGAYRTFAEGEPTLDAPIFVFNPRHTFHRDRFETSGGVFFSINVPIRRAEEAESLGMPDHPTCCASLAARALLGRLMEECAAWDVDSPQVGEALCLDLIASLASDGRLDRAPPQWLKRVEGDMRDALDQDLPIDILAAQAKVHPYHFIRTFRRFHGCTPGRYRRRLRLEKAALALTSTRRPLAEIALDCGFADQAHFSRRFRQAFGFTPAVFRRMALG